MYFSFVATNLHVVTTSLGFRELVATACPIAILLSFFRTVPRLTCLMALGDTLEHARSRT